MNSMVLLAALTMAGAGAVAVYYGLAARRQPATDIGDYLRDLDDVETHNEFELKLAEPFATRILRPLARELGSITRLTPKNHIDGIRYKLLTAGLAHQVRAEEFVVAQVASFGLALLMTLAWVVLASPAFNLAVLGLILGPAVGLLLPSSWLTRKVNERQAAIRKDLPDTLDLLAISVEAGMGFEGAMAIVCEHFQSPLANEFERALREMELGLPRKDAFKNLKRRTNVAELSNFVLAILQADALGIPVGRVLRTQAAEMRAKRRQWAREKAAKLPVKMLMPLVFLIFPAVLIIVLGPAASGFMTVLG